MRRRPASRGGSDRLVVRTFTEAGEEIAFGEPGVTDHERSAAGRQTIAERSRELLSGNRRRAAQQLAAPLPEGENVRRVWWPRDPADLRARIGDNPLGVWAEGDVLHVLWHGGGEGVHLGGGIQPRLWPVDGAADLWEASVRIRNLQEAVITIAAFSSPSDLPSPTTAALVWRGPHAAAMRRRVVGHLAGTIERHVLPSNRAGAARPVTVYRPHDMDPSRPLVGCILADGESTPGFAAVLEAAIADGSAPPVLLVGVHSGAGLGSRGWWGDRRAQEYLPGQNRYRFDAHLGFVIDDVIPWATRYTGAERTTWVAAGFSNGAAWAIAAAQRRPDVFKGVAAFSAGVVPRRVAGPARAAGVRHYLAAGALEPGFRRSTKEWAERLDRAGLDCLYQEWMGGHDPVWWEDQFPAALAWLAGAPNSQA